MKREEIELLLPSAFRRNVRSGQPLAALLELMESLHEPDENVISRLDTFFHPHRTRDEFAAYLARWVDLHWVFPVSTGPGFLRELISSGAELAQWRGAAKGLTLFLQTATGTPGFEIDEEVLGPDDEPIPFHIRIRAPKSSSAHRAMIERIVESEKPAYVTFELQFGEQSQGDG